MQGSCLVRFDRRLKGSKAAVASGLFGTKETVTRNMIEPLIRELKSTGGKFLDDRDHHNQVLTNNERIKLAEWILACGDGQKPKGLAAG